MEDQLPSRNNARLILTVVAVAAASLTIVPLLVHALGWLPMYFLMDLLAGPAVVLLLAVGVFAHRINETVFLQRLLTGAWTGLAATLAYDGVRWLIVVARIFIYNPFISHPIFGSLITGYPEESNVAVVVGWTYHFWNGISFGMMYTLIAGRAHWAYGIAWAMFLEAAWLTTLPSVIQRDPNLELVIISIFGHLAYGLVLGVLSRRFVRA